MLVEFSVQIFVTYFVQTLYSECSGIVYRAHMIKCSLEYDIDPSLCVRNLGVWFDSRLSMSTHVTKLCNSSFYHLHNNSSNQRL